MEYQLRTLLFKTERLIARAQNLFSCFLLCGVIHPFQFIQISKENLSNIMDHLFSLQTRESGYEEISLRKN